MKLTRCPAPPTAADSPEDTPRDPKSTSLKLTSSGVPLVSRPLSITTLAALLVLATVEGYQTHLRNSVSKNDVSQGNSGSVLTMVATTVPEDTTVPSGTPRTNKGNSPLSPCFSNNLSNPSALYGTPCSLHSSSS